MAAITPPGEWIYGVALPIHTLTATLADPWEHSATVDDLVSIARKAENTGHHFVGVTDHVAIPDNDYAAHMSTTWYDTVATLSYLAACTEHGQPGLGGVDRGLPAPAADRQVVRHPRSPLGRAGPSSGREPGM